MNFFLISLGCPKNLTDSEDFCANLISHGHKMVFDLNLADAVIINTCAFLASSIKEAKDNIKAALKLKAEGKIKKIIVTGCMVDRLKTAVKEEFPEIDLILSISEQARMDKLIKKEGEFIKKIQTSLSLSPYKMTLTLPHSAYLKVADGCNNRCAYCAIPYIRGNYRSKSMEDVLEEAKIMAEDGVKEFSLIAQDTTSYGQDLYGKPQLEKLIKKLVKIKKLERIRIMYAYPHRVSRELAEIMAGEEKLYPYIDIPLQHISDKMLKAMRRHAGAAQTKEVLSMLRETVPGIAIRTNFIVGFPGETEADFEELKSFVADFKFDNIGIFEFFREPGTPAYDMKPQISAKIKKDRAEALAFVQSRVIDEINKKLIGSEVEVISDGETSGRTYKDAPDIDGTVEFTSPVEAGRIFKGEIVAAEGYKRVVKPL
ncbi:MAG: 30S ribosomal protein S12 methylthiotransferase RimO [Elusimicrobia bacterium]|nr:30S ribosomal protein S12 methylthiotransferase RimO [Elusimicrobiota bacterium]